MLSEEEIVLLCSFEDDMETSGSSEYLRKLSNGEWHSVVPEVNEDIKTKEDLLKFWICNGNESIPNRMLAIGVASLCAFCEANWTGPSSKSAEIIHEKYSKYFDSAKEAAEFGEEIYPTIVFPDLLAMANAVFSTLLEKKKDLIIYWWKLRSYIIYQKILDENSSRVYANLDNILKELKNLEQKLDTSPKLQSVLNVEMSQVYLMYGRVQESEICLKKAQTICGLSMTLKGALGNRTRYQQRPIAQLTLNVKTTCSGNRILALKTHGSSALMRPLNLNDDLRLNNIHFLEIDENNTKELTSVEQQICITTCQHIQRSQPKDELADEEVFPYVNTLLAQKHGPWATRINTFLILCRLESKNKRTVERAMMQCEEVVNSYNKELPKNTNRLSYLWASGLPPVIQWRSLLADLLISIGLVKAALDIYLELQMWEEIIACYTILELRHKAAEIIQQQIDIKPTVKLYCLLGDATDDITQYEKAWELSKHKSSKAQRHWGNFLFSHKKYEECIPHYQKSCDINSLQESVWLRLGYAALTVEKWDLAATAYRRYTYLEPHSFEAWNNLAKVYVKQGNKERAYKALCETIKYNYDNWQVWENMLIVSLDTGHFDDVVRSYHRLLDLRSKHLDIEVLTMLVKAIIEEKDDTQGNSVTRIIPKVLELFGRITSAHPNESELWQLYADISPNSLLKGQRLLKSYKAISQNDDWVNDPMLCEKVITLVDALGSVALKAIETKECLDMNQVWQLVSSARLTLQGIIRAVSNKKIEELNDKILYLKNILDNLTSELQKR